MLFILASLAIAHVQVASELSSSHTGWEPTNPRTLKRSDRVDLFETSGLEANGITAKSPKLKTAAKPAKKAEEKLATDPKRKQDQGSGKDVSVLKKATEAKRIGHVKIKNAVVKTGILKDDLKKAEKDAAEAKLAAATGGDKRKADATKRHVKELQDKLVKARKKVKSLVKGHREIQLTKEEEEVKIRFRSLQGKEKMLKSQIDKLFRKELDPFLKAAKQKRAKNEKKMKKARKETVELLKAAYNPKAKGKEAVAENKKIEGVTKKWSTKLDRATAKELKAELKDFLALKSPEAKFRKKAQTIVTSLKEIGRGNGKGQCREGKVTKTDSVSIKKSVTKAVSLQKDVKEVKKEAGALKKETTEALAKAEKFKSVKFKKLFTSHWKSADGLIRTFDKLSTRVGGAIERANAAIGKQPVSKQLSMHEAEELRDENDDARHLLAETKDLKANLSQEEKQRSIAHDDVSKSEAKALTLLENAEKVACPDAKQAGAPGPKKSASQRSLHEVQKAVKNKGNVSEITASLQKALEKIRECGGASKPAAKVLILEANRAIANVIEDSKSEEEASDNIADGKTNLEALGADARRLKGEAEKLAKEANIRSSKAKSPEDQQTATQDSIQASRLVSALGNVSKEIGDLELPSQERMSAGELSKNELVVAKRISSLKAGVLGKAKAVDSDLQRSDVKEDQKLALSEARESTKKEREAVVKSVKDLKTSTAVLKENAALLLKAAQKISNSIKARKQAGLMETAAHTWRGGAAHGSVAILLKRAQALKVRAVELDDKADREQIVTDTMRATAENTINSASELEAADDDRRKSPFARSEEDLKRAEDMFKAASKKRERALDKAKKAEQTAKTPEQKLEAQRLMVEANALTAKVKIESEILMTKQRDLAKEKEKPEEAERIAKMQNSVHSVGKKEEGLKKVARVLEADLAALKRSFATMTSPKDLEAKKMLKRQKMSAMRKRARFVKEKADDLYEEAAVAKEKATTIADTASPKGKEKAARVLKQTVHVVRTVKELKTKAKHLLRDAESLGKVKCKRVQPTPLPTHRVTSPPVPWPTRLPTANPTVTPTAVPSAAFSPREKPKPKPAPVPWPTPFPTMKKFVPPVPYPTPFPSVGLTTREPDTKVPWPTERPTPKPIIPPVPFPTPRPTKLPVADPVSWPTQMPTPRHETWPRPTPPPPPPPPPGVVPPTPKPTIPPVPWPTPKPTPRPISPPVTWPTNVPTSKPTPVPVNPVPFPTPKPTRRPEAPPVLYPTPKPTPKPMPQGSPPSPPGATSGSPPGSSPPTQRPVIPPVPWPTPFPTMSCVGNDTRTKDKIKKSLTDLDTKASKLSSKASKLADKAKKKLEMATRLKKKALAMQKGSPPQ